MKKLKIKNSLALEYTKHEHSYVQKSKELKLSQITDNRTLRFNSWEEVFKHYKMKAFRNNFFSNKIAKLVDLTGERKMYIHNLSHFTDGYNDKYNCRDNRLVINTRIKKFIGTDLAYIKIIELNEDDYYKPITKKRERSNSEIRTENITHRKQRAADLLKKKFQTIPQNVIDIITDVTERASTEEQGGEFVLP